MSRILVIALLCSIAASSPAFAGAVFSLESTSHSSDQPQTVDILLTVQGQNLKMSVMSPQAGAAHEMIFKGASQQIVGVSHADHVYVVMDRETMKGLQGQMDEAMKQMQKALENMPEDQRAMAEKMMPSLKDKMAEGADAKVPTELRDTGEHETIAGYACKRYELLRKGSVFQKVWVTDWKNVEGGDQLSPTLREFTTFLQDTMGSLAAKYGFDLDDGPFAAWKQIDGCPVKSEQYDGGKMVAEAVLKSAKVKDVDASAFEPPAGYHEASVSEGP